MERQFYLDLAASGLRMPIGADLILHQHDDPTDIMHNANQLGAVVAEAATHYRTPLAFPLMDLRLEKADLLEFLGVPEAQADTYHFDAPPAAKTVREVEAAAARPFSRRITANQGAVRYIAEQTELLPVGMLIGPFSLMTKLVADPIAPVAMAGAGMTAEDDPGILLIERCLQLALLTVQRSALAQIRAGAKAIIVCEPAANTVYLSPRQLKAGSNIFEKYVLEPNRQLRALFRQHATDLLFHDCGELTTAMVQSFATELEPSMMSLGSSRNLWEDAQAIPKDIVLYGNLPTKTFYSDAAMPVDEVRRRTRELNSHMRTCGHPHILGSECDVLHVPDAAETIRQKVEAMLTA
jgi:uroporphyrinogen-III decarboxylase